jgi:PDZ domain
MRQAFLTLLISGLTATLCQAQGNGVTTKPQAKGESHGQVAKHPYLGVEIEAVPPVLSSQLSSILPHGEGVLILRVTKDSPAAKAGLQAYDVLLSYGGHKLTSPDELINLVRAGTSGHEVPIDFVRGGKAESCKVTLGEHEWPLEQERPRVFRFLPDERLRHMFEETESTGESPAWETFDALKLTRLADHRWRAEIEFRSKEGKKVQKQFEGTRAEIRKDIRAEKDLPADERSHLLRALNLHEPVFEFHFPPFGPTPPGSSNHP